MELTHFTWFVGYSHKLDVPPEELYPATVPGAVQLDYARAKKWPDYCYGTNFKDYAWMEDVYWLYRTSMDFSLDADQSATLIFKGIDYKYQIRIDASVIAEGEGMFTPVVCDVTGYAGSAHTLEVLIYPAPKAGDSGVRARSQARFSCKPAACYGWDWHPRLISSGIYDEAGLLIQHRQHIQSVDVSYILNESLDFCKVHVHTALSAGCTIYATLLYQNEAVAQHTQFCSSNSVDFSLDVHSPMLWHPSGFGAQPIYQLHVAVVDAGGQVVDEAVRKIGFRRSKLVMNEGSWAQPKAFPKSRSDAPATLEINGTRIFAKGSNWVNASVFPGTLTQADYASLLNLVKDANMNILRIWGGGFVNHEAFYDLCDEKGIMVWQEFPLACNEYPDDDRYLSVLEREATSIVRRLRSHPCVVIWCGGNELFNGWSKMTDQHHALRLLDKVCYSEDCYTPYIMTSPLNGMGHGHYLNYDEDTQQEFITTLVHSAATAYTEFGSPSAASPEYIQKFMSDADFTDCNAENEVWSNHHAFLAWRPASWLRKPEADYYFGGYRDVNDLCVKTQFIQAMCCRSYFEEMRRQWPHCSMALNWCFNEPWPTFANNSLLSWPNIPKPGYFAVQSALRPQALSLKVDRHLWWSGDTFEAEVWVLHDSLQELSNLVADISYKIGDQAAVSWGQMYISSVPPQHNVKCGSISFPLSVDRACKISIMLNASAHPEMDSEYTYLCRPHIVMNTAGILNI